MNEIEKSLGIVVNAIKEDKLTLIQLRDLAVELQIRAAKLKELYDGSMKVPE